MKKDNCIVIGIDLGGSAIRLSTVTSRGKIRYSRRVDISGRREKRYILSSIIENITELTVIEKHAGNRICAVGIGSPGIIDLGKGVVITSPNFTDWKGVRLKSILENAVNLPVVLDNDANAAAYGEKWKGAGRRADSLVCLTMGTGIGGGIILNGEVWHGADGMAGEIGHMTVDPSGPRCNCGNYGCLEAYSSATGMIRSAVGSIKLGKRSSLRRLSSGRSGNITSKMIYDAALTGDRLSINILNDAGKYLGIAMAGLINILNPEMIVLTGAVTGAWDFFMPAAMMEMRKRAYEVLTDRTKIVRGRLADTAGIVGAAGLAIKQL
ncbi:MAG: ROK family protein [Nitrospirae bacterium]|nr:ROK family protein [Nitrospirota bacterium]